MQAFILNFTAKEKIGEVKKVLQKAADTNKRKLPELDISPQVGSVKMFSNQKYVFEPGRRCKRLSS